MKNSILSLAAGLALLASPAWAHDYKLGSLEIDHPWSRATAPTAPTGGGYLVITNKGTTPDRLIAARSNAAAKVEIHEMTMNNNIMRMRELPKGLEIPAGQTVTLKPGGFHVMFLDLKAPFAKGAKIPVTLVFEKAGSIDVDFMVQDMGASEPGHAMH